MRRITPATGAAAEARPLIRAMEPGQSITVALPTSKFWKKEAYGHVAGAAASILGPGTFRMDGRSVPGSVVVTRLAVS